MKGPHSTGYIDPLSPHTVSLDYAGALVRFDKGSQLCA